jgi:hypothetical protein
MNGEHPQSSFLDDGFVSGRLLELRVGEHLLLHRPLAWPSLCNHQLHIKNFSFLQIPFIVSS